MRKLIITMLPILAILAGLITSIGTAAAETNSWESKNLCFNYGSDCPSDDSGTISFGRPVILVSARITWISTGEWQSNESSDVEVEFFGKSTGSSGSSRVIKPNSDNEIVTSVSVAAHHNGLGSAVPPNIAGSHKVQVSIIVKDIATATTVLPSPTLTNTPKPTAIDGLLTPVTIDPTSTTTIPTATTEPTPTTIPTATQVPECTDEGKVDGDRPCTEIPMNPPTVSVSVVGQCLVDNGVVSAYFRVNISANSAIYEATSILDGKRNTFFYRDPTEPINETIQEQKYTLPVSGTAQLEIKVSGWRTYKTAVAVSNPVTDDCRPQVETASVENAQIQVEPSAIPESSRRKPITSGDTAMNDNSTNLLILELIVGFLLLSAGTVLIIRRKQVLLAYKAWKR
jgi:hypothetical protein